MSVYCSWLFLDEHDERRAPVAYQGSHVIPDPATDEREGWLEVGVIPNHVPAYRNGESADIEDDSAALAAYKVKALRLGVGTSQGDGHTVILDAEQATALRDVLTAWLEQDVTW